MKRSHLQIINEEIAKLKVYDSVRQLVESECESYLLEKKKKKKKKDSKTKDTDKNTDKDTNSKKNKTKKKNKKAQRWEGEKDKISATKIKQITNRLKNPSLNLAGIAKKTMPGDNATNRSMLYKMRDGKLAMPTKLANKIFSELTQV